MSKHTSAVSKFIAFIAAKFFEMAAESGTDTCQEAKEIYTARELLACSEFESLLHNVE